MRLVKWEPRADLWLDKVMSNFFSDLPAEGSSEGEITSWVPRSDVEEQEDRYRIQIDLPGMKKDQIRVTVEKGILEIAGERSSEKEEKSKGYRRRERTFGSFRRSFRLPDAVDAEKIASTYENGVLTVEVPKSEKALPRQIEVKVR